MNNHLFTLTSLLQAVEQYFGESILTPERIALCMNKGEAFEHLIHLGMNIPREDLAKVSDEAWSEIVASVQLSHLGTTLSAQDITGLDVVGHEKGMPLDEDDSDFVSAVVSYTWTEEGIKELRFNFVVIKEERTVRIGTAHVSAVFPHTNPDLVDAADSDSEYMFQCAHIAEAILEQMETSWRQLELGLAVIQHFIIEEDVRGKGFGKAAFAELLAVLRKERISFLFVDPRYRPSSPEDATQSEFSTKRIERFLGKYGFWNAQEVPPIYLSAILALEDDIFLKELEEMGRGDDDDL